MPSTKENALPMAKLRLAKARRSTIGFPAVKTRQKKNTADAPLTSAKAVSAPSSNQP